MILYIIHLIASDACLKMYRQMYAFVLTSELKLKPLSQFYEATKHIRTILYKVIYEDLRC